MKQKVQAKVIVTRTFLQYQVSSLIHEHDTIIRHVFSYTFSLVFMPECLGVGGEEEGEMLVLHKNKVCGGINEHVP